MPAASAQAQAARALRTLCSPAAASLMVNVTSSFAVVPRGELSRVASFPRVPAFAGIVTEVSCRSCSACSSPAHRRHRSSRRSARARSAGQPRHSAVYSSSPGNTATPSAGKACSTEPFSRATASTVCMNSWCSRWALLTRATVGAAMAARRAISPGWFMPSSTTAALCARSQAHHGQRHADLVVQVALRGQARLLADACGEDRGDHFLDRGLAVAAGDADDGNRKLAAPGIADAAQGRQRVRHHQRRQREVLRQLSTTTAATFLAATWSRKSWASKVSPRSATNSAPAGTVRLSVDTPSKAASRVMRTPAIEAVSNCASEPRIS
jgi:hypothetical protein